MLDKVLNLFKRPDGNDTDNTIDTGMAAAALMLEVIWADHDIDDKELTQARELLANHVDGDAQSLDQLIMDAKERLADSVGVQPYTRLINEEFSEEEKYAVVVALWRLALADDHIDRFEEHTIRRIADLLYLSHGRFIEAKIAVKASA